MIFEILGGAVLLAGGFGLGRIKNKKKLAAISAEISALESKASSAVPLAGELLSFVSKLKSL